MAVTDQSGLVPRRRAGDEAAPAPQDQSGEATGPAVEQRARTPTGHCCDGRPCDHPDHGPPDTDGGVIHFIF
jgi:hypothetical protein